MLSWVEHKKSFIISGHGLASDANFIRAVATTFGAPFFYVKNLIYIYFI